MRYVAAGVSVPECNQNARSLPISLDLWTPPGHALCCHYTGNWRNIKQCSVWYISVFHCSALPGSSLYFTGGFLTVLHWTVLHRSALHVSSLYWTECFFIVAQCMFLPAGQAEGRAGKWARTGLCCKKEAKLTYSIIYITVLLHHVLSKEMLKYRYFNLAWSLKALSGLLSL